MKFLKKITSLYNQTNDTYKIWLSLFIIVRIFSYITFTYNLGLLNNLVSIILITLFAHLSYKKNDVAFVLVVAELILGGAGAFLSLGGFIIRTWLLGIFGVTWLYHKLKQKDLSILSIKKFKWPFLIVTAVILTAMINGFVNQHQTMFILQDAMLYFFLFLIFPLFDYYQTIKKQLKNIVEAFIYGTSIVTFFILGLYSSGVGELPDSFYHWFRNVAGGKITDVGGNLFRIVTSEHLFIVPIILVLFSTILHKKKQKKAWVLLALLLAVLVLNMTRIYLLALIISMICLALKQSIKRWLFVSTMVMLMISGWFVSFSFVTSYGSSIGGSLFGLKFSGVTDPNAEVSGATRMIILPKAIEVIKTHPFVGSGLATEITFYNPAINKEVTRTQFDWGYLEMIAELGIIGALFYCLFFIFFGIPFLIKNYISKATKDKVINRGLIAGAVSLFVINLTTPALFQGYGVLYLIFVVVVSIKMTND